MRRVNYLYYSLICGHCRSGVHILHEADFTGHSRIYAGVVELALVLGQGVLLHFEGQACVCRSGRVVGNLSLLDDQQLLLVQIVKVADVKLGKKVTLFNMLPGGYIDRLQGSAAFREAGVILRFAEYVAGRNGLVLYCFLLGCVGGVGYVLDRNGRRFEEFFLGREKKAAGHTGH